MFKKIFIALILIVFLGTNLWISYNKTSNQVIYTPIDSTVKSKVSDILIDLPLDNLILRYDDLAGNITGNVQKSDLRYFLDKYDLSNFATFLATLVLPKEFVLSIDFTISTDLQIIITKVKIDQLSLNTNIILK